MSPRYLRGKSPQTSKPKRPPNYLSRRVQWKVFMLVAMLMLVLTLMQEARKPKNWAWMWELQNGPWANRQAADAEPVDTRVHEPPPSRQGEITGPLIVTGEADSQRTQEDEEAIPAFAECTTPIQRTERDAWSRLLDALSKEDRECFLAGLKDARDSGRLSEARAKNWPRIVGLLDQGYTEYLDRASQTIAEDDGQLTLDEKKLWQRVIEQLRTGWRQRLLPALSRLNAETAIGEENGEFLRNLQTSLDAVFLTTIKDSTVFRAGEKDAWFRMFERLDHMDLERLEADSIGQVSFLQLYRQPDDYRGRLVSVRGTIRLGAYRDAPDNFYGIEGYYVLWLKPDGANSPIVVYSLDLPDGFPDVKAMRQEANRVELSEDVEFTGFFFKRWAYRSQDGTRLAPLVLAKTPRWEAPPAGSATADTTLSWPMIWSIIAGTALFGITFATLVFVTSNRRVGPDRRPGSSIAASPVNSSGTAGALEPVRVVTDDT